MDSLLTDSVYYKKGDYRSEKQQAFEQEAEGVRSAVAEGNLAEAKKRLACLAKAAEKDIDKRFAAAAFLFQTLGEIKCKIDPDDLIFFEGHRALYEAGP